LFLFAAAAAVVVIAAVFAYGGFIQVCATECGEAKNSGSKALLQVCQKISYS